MKAWALAALSAGLSTAAGAQGHDMHAMPGMTMPGMTMPMPARPAAKAPSSKPTPRPPVRLRRRAPATAPGGNGAMSPAMPSEAAGTAAVDHAGMDHAAMGHAGMDHAAMGHDGAPAGTALPAGHAPPPSLPADHYADRVYPPAAMAAARARMMGEHGGRTFAQVFFNLAEVQARAGRDGYRWDGEAWIGGDIDRLVVETEGEGAFRRGADHAEAQALYSRAIGPYFNLQAGVRQDLGRRRRRTYASIGVEGLAPYMFDVEARLFVADGGQVLARLEGWYDQRVTQRLVLQPRVELNLAAQDDAATRTGAGLSDAEAGLRLRYEVARTFAPYVGLSREARVGRSAHYARIDGERAAATSLVAGVRAWF